MDSRKSSKKEQHRIMKNNSTSRRNFIHLYNPQVEGLGPYDVHYINAYKNNMKNKKKNFKAKIERNAA